MGFLRLLAAGRTAVLDGFFSGLTYFGSELAFMAAALLMFWCIDKRQGYYVFLVGAGRSNGQQGGQEGEEFEAHIVIESSFHGVGGNCDCFMGGRGEE